MALFLSSFRKAIDKKGRVSVPSSFRHVLAGEDFQGVVVYASFINPCVEACGMRRIETLHQFIETLDPFSEEHDAFSATILGGSVQLMFDGEGRIVLPPDLRKSAEIGEEVVFVGKGNTFELWSPERFAEHAEKSRTLALEKRGKLHAGLTGGAAG